MLYNSSNTDSFVMKRAAGGLRPVRLNRSVRTQSTEPSDLDAFIEEKTKEDQDHHKHKEDNSHKHKKDKTHHHHQQHHTSNDAHRNILNNGHPRIFIMADVYHEASSSKRESLLKSIHKPRELVLYPSEFTDNTQLYPLRDSDDQALDKMEIRDPFVQGECVPMQDWQTTFHPSCNGMHELDIVDTAVDEEDGGDIALFGTKGFWRNAWKVDLKGDGTTLSGRDTVVLKTLKYVHNFEDAHFEHDRVDAVAMERLTGSPHVINIFGFCGHSVLTEFADGPRLGELADKSKRRPLKRLSIARDIASGLADVHGIDGNDNVTFVHLDINPANVISVGGTLKLNDFNIGILRKWNTTANKPCGFPAQYPNPQWRSPEEANESQELTEKVDVFAMGHIFFRLICGHEPWNKLEPGGRPDKEEVSEKVKTGSLPFVPEFIMNTTDPEMVTIRTAMLSCYTFDPEKRPSSREIATFLDEELNRLIAIQGPVEDGEGKDKKRKTKDSTKKKKK